MWYKNRQRSKKNNFYDKNDIEAEGLSHPKSIGILTVSICIFGPQLVILASYRANKVQWDIFFNFKLNLTLKIKVNQFTKQQACEPY